MNSGRHSNAGIEFTLDDKGKRCDYGRIPTSVVSLRDDPFRSLASSVRRAGGYAKNKLPFSEFQWADFLRYRITSKTVASDFDRALTLAMCWSRRPEAAGLPGWLGMSGAKAASMPQIKISE